jgi:hypothetical protein
MFYKFDFCSAWFALSIVLETWADHYSLLSNMTPRTFIEFWDLIAKLKSLILISGWSSQWNRRNLVLDSLTDSPKPLKPTGYGFKTQFKIDNEGKHMNVHLIAKL